MVRFRIRLDTMANINKFVSIATSVSGNVDLSDGDGHCVSAKSLLGALATMDWDRIYCTCPESVVNFFDSFLI